MTDLKYLQKFFFLLVMGFSLSTLLACDDDDDEEGGGGDAVSTLQGTWGLTEYYCIEKYDGDEYKVEVSGTPEEIYEETGDYVYVTLLEDGSGYWSERIGQPGESFKKWRYENGKLSLLYNEEEGYDEEDAWNVSFRTPDIVVLEDEEKEDGEYYYERYVFSRVK